MCRAPLAIVSHSGETLAFLFFGDGLLLLLQWSSPTQISIYIIDFLLTTKLSNLSIPLTLPSPYPSLALLCLRFLIIITVLFPPAPYLQAPQT